ncbi:MAG: hypothetical protein HRT71_14565 [Flavobacteriales bacterium]|nr:hypothetical protein [Flavobacteriales bacterium]
MKVNYLFPHRFKKIGWVILVLALILGGISFFTDYRPEFLNVNMPALIFEEITGDKEYFSFQKDNLLNEISGMLIIISAMFVAFSKEKLEDEYVAKIRMESLVWATYINYAVLLFSILFIYGLSFFTILVFNMFTVLLFFIIRFNWQILKLNNSIANEE